jgi:2-oxoglutarate ferredoxin oxidoreductase subunit alpha
MDRDSVTIAFVGSGGAGVMTAGQMLLDTAAKAGWYGYYSRSSGPQIRGGEAAAFIRLSPRPLFGPSDHVDLIIAFDWQNIERFAAELPLVEQSVIITDPSQGEIPPVLRASGARTIELPLKEIAGAIKGGRPNMVGLGAAASVAGLPLDAIEPVVRALIGKKGEAAIQASLDAADAGALRAAEWGLDFAMPTGERPAGARWSLSGNEAAGFGAIKAGVRFCAAYPITPATEVLEWLAPHLSRIGGMLVQAEDEIASINMCIGASYGGVPSVTATSGPGLALMIEALGLAVSSETPVVVIDVMRVGPSTGIATKSEQSDLNIAVYGLHGDAPHLVVAPNSIADCAYTTQWGVHLAESLQAPCLVLSDQALGQARTITDRPPDADFTAQRLLATFSEGEPYLRYADTPSGVSPVAFPGMPGGEHTADGLEHGENALPSAQAKDHEMQLEKRLRKLTGHDYGASWADIEGEGDVAVLTWGSITGAAREAIARLNAQGTQVRLISMRLIAPLQIDRLLAALQGVRKLLILEQSHGAQFHKYLRAHLDLPVTPVVFNRPGPLPIRAQEVCDQIALLLPAKEELAA